MRTDTRQSRLPATPEQPGALNWPKPVVVASLYHKYFQPACKALDRLGEPRRGR
jgi:hypothetical protein